MALIDQYAGVVCDLDGVVYAGPTAIEHAVPALTRVAESGRAVIYATNNAARPPEAVAGHLAELGLPVGEPDVINSSMAGAHVLAQSLPAGSSVLAIGGEGVSLALKRAGLTPVAPTGADVTVAAVLQGYGREVCAADLAEAAYAIQSGARWVATNTDLTLPTDRGRAPGNGSLVGAVRNAVDVDPEIVGKPEPTMYDMAAERMKLAPASVVAIGDRLETDIEGANRGGYDSILVLTGVHGWEDAAAAPVGLRPTYVVDDLRALWADFDDSTPRWTTLRSLWAKVDSGEITSDQARERMADQVKVAL